MNFLRFWLLLQSKCQDKKILTSTQFSFLKTRILCFFKKLVLLLLVQVFEDCSNMSVKLFSIHLLFQLFSLLSFVLCFFRTFVCSVAGLPAFEAPSFLHQLGSFIEHQSVDVHHVQVSFLPRKIESGCWFL